MNDSGQGSTACWAEELKVLIGLTEEDARLVRELGDRVRSSLDGSVERALCRFRGTPSLAPLVATERKEAEVRRHLRSTLDLLLGGAYDHDYVDRRLRIASSPAFSRPPSRWYPGSHAIFFEELGRLAEKAFEGDPAKRLGVLGAVWRVLLFDLQVLCGSCLGQAVGNAPPLPAAKAAGEEEALRNRISEALHDDLMWNYPEMVLAMNERGEIVEANRAAREALGYDQEEMHQLTIRHLIAESHHPRIGMHLDRVIRDGRDRVEAHIVSRSGEEKQVELVSTAVRDFAGKYLGARIFIHDMASRRKLEQEMLRLDRLVAVGSMAAKVAHEIRNPLSSISLNVDLLLDEIRRPSRGDSAEAESLVHSILSEIDRLTNIIEEYLSFGRLPSPALEAVDPEPFLHSVADFVRPDLQAHQIDLSIEVLPGTPRLLADRNQVRQSILNLFRNAQEAMPSGGSLKVVAGTRDGEVVIEVRDSGIGIPKEEIRKIFDPFYTTKDYGSGLGLAFVQQVMREHRGRVTCRSDAGSGAVFALHFPSAEE